MDFYSAEELSQIITKSAGRLGVPLTQDAGHELARRSRGTPRVANRMLRRARDFAEVEGDGRITLEIAQLALQRLGIDEEGLDGMDRRILQTISQKFDGGPVGLESLGVAISEDAKTIEEVYEPYLIKEGFIQRTSRGRIALDKTYKYLNINNPNNTQTDMFE